MRTKRAGILGKVTVMLSLELFSEKGWKSCGNPVATSISACPLHFNTRHLVTLGGGTGMMWKSLEVEYLE